jgi:uncharacterized protein YfeS
MYHMSQGNKSRNIIVATTIPPIRIRFYILQRLRQRIFEALQSVTSLLQLVSQYLYTEIVFLNIARQVPIQVA